MVISYVYDVWCSQAHVKESFSTGLETVSFAVLMVHEHTRICLGIFGSPLISTPQWVADNREWISMLPQNYQDAINKHEAAGTGIYFVTAQTSVIGVIHAVSVCVGIRHNRTRWNGLVEEIVVAVHNAAGVTRAALGLR